MNKNEQTKVEAALRLLNDALGLVEKDAVAEDKQETAGEPTVGELAKAYAELTDDELEIHIRACGEAIAFKTKAPLKPAKKCDEQQIAITVGPQTELVATSNYYRVWQADVRSPGVCLGCTYLGTSYLGDHFACSNATMNKTRCRYSGTEGSGSDWGTPSDKDSAGVKISQALARKKGLIP